MTNEIHDEIRRAVQKLYEKYPDSVQYEQAMISDIVSRKITAGESLYDYLVGSYWKAKGEALEKKIKDLEAKEAQEKAAAQVAAANENWWETIQQQNLSAQNQINDAQQANMLSNQAFQQAAEIQNYIMSTQEAFFTSPPMSGSLAGLNFNSPAAKVDPPPEVPIQSGIQEKKGRFINLKKKS